MYDKSDPRAQPSPAPKGPAKILTGLIAEEQLATFYDTPPQIDDAEGRTWFIRGNNFVVAYSEVKPGGSLTRQDQIDEYVALMPDAPSILVAGDDRDELAGGHIAFLPPGNSSVTLPEGGVLVRLFTARSRDMVENCPNARAYETPRTHIPELSPWTEPPEGLRLRSYSLDVPPEKGRFGRIFRCTTFMVNMLDAREGPRAPSSVSPHHHDDFEQCSLLLEGAYDHHLRWPWTTDMADWRADKAIEVTGPSVLVIPPPVIHTSRAKGEGINRLVDIFCPPREDFSAKPGWVLNAADYPA